MLTEFKVDLKLATSMNLNLLSLVEVLTDNRRLRSMLLYFTACSSCSSRGFAEHDRYQRISAPKRVTILFVTINFLIIEIVF